MGSLPGVWGFVCSKASAGYLAYRAAGRISFDVSCGASPPTSRVHVMCSCVNKGMISEQNFSELPKVVSRYILPMGCADLPGTIPWKVVLEGCSCLWVNPILWKVS